MGSSRERKLIDRGFDLRPMVSWVSLNKREMANTKAAERDRQTMLEVEDGPRDEPFKGLKNRLGQYVEGTADKQSSQESTRQGKGLRKLQLKREVDAEF